MRLWTLKEKLFLKRQMSTSVSFICDNVASSEFYMGLWQIKWHLHFISGKNSTHEPLFKKIDLVKVELHVIGGGGAMLNWNESQLYSPDNFKCKTSTHTKFREISLIISEVKHKRADTFSSLRLLSMHLLQITHENKKSSEMQCYGQNLYRLPPYLRPRIAQLV
jgi:hypothetical protein